MEGKLDLALDYFSRSAKIRKQIGDKLGRSSSLLNMGIVLRDSGRLDDARKCLTECYKIRKETKSRHLLTEVNTELQKL